MARHSQSMHNVSRRKLMAMGAAGLPAIVAGCVGDEDNGSGDTFTAATWTVPGDGHYNPYNPTNHEWLANQMLWDELAKYDEANDEFIPLIVNDWEDQGDILSLELSDEYIWDNGDDVTVEDLETKLILDKHFGESVWTYLEDIEITGEQTIDLHLSGSVNRDVLYHELFPTLLDTPQSQYGEYAEDLENADSDSERDEIIEELIGWALEDPIANGPFSFDRTSENQIHLVKHEDYPFQGETNINEMVYDYNPSGEANWEAMREGILNGTTFYAPPHVKEVFPDHIYELQYPEHGGISLGFNQDHELFGQVEVRKAIAYLLDRPPIAQNTDEEVHYETPIICGLSPEIADEWLSDVEDQFIEYRQDEDEAEALLTDAGFSNDDGTWYTPDGDEFEVPIVAPAGSPEMVDNANTIASQLQDAGINGVVNSIEQAAYFEVRDTADFETISTAWGSWGDRHPYFHFDNEFTGSLATDAFSQPEEVSVPPFGDPGGDPQTVNVAEMVEALGAAEDEDEARELTQELAWVYNQTLPKITTSSHYQQAWLATDNWDVPDEDDPLMQIRYPYMWLPRIGEINYTG